MRGRPSLSEAAHEAIEALDLSVHPDRDALLARVAGMGEKRRGRILRAALRSHFEDERRRPFRAELAKLGRDVRADGRRVLVLVEGRDGAGKGGTIGRITRSMDPTTCRVVPFRRPSVHDLAAPFFDRYTAHLPRPGEVVFFDRSWYGRALVEPVMGFCTPAEHAAFLEDVGPYERRLLDDGVTLLKIYLSVTRAEQARRLAQRDPDWLSDVDRAAQAHWDDHTLREVEMLQRTHTDDRPWWVVGADDRQRALREVTKLLLRRVPYEGLSRTLDFTADPTVCRRGDGRV